MKYLLKIIILLLISSSCLNAQKFGDSNFLTSGANEAYEVLAADFDNDDDLDVLYIYESGGKTCVNWLENIGDTVIAPKYSIGAFPHNTNIGSLIEHIHVDVADINGDNYLDVVLGHVGVNSILWLENLGGGLFGPPCSIGEQFEVEDLNLADMDNDGDVDVVLTVSSGYDPLILFENLGSGTFSSGSGIYNDPTANYEETFVGDFDADGDQDIAVASGSWTLGGLVFFDNLGNGNFDGPILISNDLQNPTAIYGGDVDYDGDLDLVFASGWTSQDKFAWYENLGDNTFGSEHMISENFDWIIDIQMSDLNGDGISDLICGLSSDNNILWFENNGLGDFGFSNSITSQVEDVEAVFAIDIDSDGDVDILSASEEDSEICLFKNNGLGEFGEKQVLANAESIFFIGLSDISNDGQSDLYIYQNNDVLMFENLGLMNFSDLNSIDLEFDPIGYTSFRTLSFDFDQDGDTDFLTPGQDAKFFTNNGFGEFELFNTLNELNISRCVQGDLDADLDLDLVCTTYNPYEIKTLLNDGTGMFSVNQILAENENYWNPDVRIVDLNSDNALDILSAQGNDFVWYANNGTGYFGDEQLISTETSARSVAAADLDNDGDNDIIVTDTFGSDEVKWFENDGNGIFPVSQIISKVGGRSLTTNDFDNDNDIDIFFVDELNYLRLYENNGQGSFCGSIIDSIFWNEVASANYSIEFCDLDLDGDEEIIALKQYEVVWKENFLGNGCTDELACNFNLDAWIDDGSCCYSNCGCTDKGATNYDFNSTCEDGSCTYKINGNVFFDENINGEFDENDIYLGLQQVNLLELGISATTNNNGEFVFYVPEGCYTLELELDINYPSNTTTSLLTTSVGPTGIYEKLNFGVHSDSDYLDFGLALFSEGNTYPCDENVLHDFIFTNFGNFPLNASMEIEFDSLFQSYEEISAIDTVIENTIFTGFENLQPGSSFHFQVDLLTPNANFLGANLETSVVTTLYDQTDTLTSDEINFSLVLACAFDPNDKQVSPVGYTDEHFISNDTPLNYLIRFQNTGNAPAQTVLVIDTLATSLDFSSLELIGYSHPMILLKDSVSREIGFLFEDIMLPDSINNESESHGFVSFSVRPLSNLPLLTEINNTAYIYFDNNEPIVTNTTWNVTYDCTLFNPTITHSDSILISSEGDYYQWYLDGNVIENAIGQQIVPLQSGDYSVEVTIDFPCIKTSNSIFVEMEGLNTQAGTNNFVFPNPVIEEFQIEFEQIEGVVEVNMYNSFGQKVRKEIKELSEGIISIHREGLNPGAYVVETILESEINIFHIIIQD